MTEQPLQVTPDMVIDRVMGDQQLVATLNENPLKVELSADGSEAELSIAEVMPPIILATVQALHDLGVINWTQDEQPPVG